MASSGTDGGSWREIGRDSLSATVDFARYAGTGASGLLWLVILYALSLGSAFIILSATVFQATTIQGSSENAGRILKVLRVIPERERHIIDQYDVTQTIVIDLKRNLRTYEAARQQAETRLGNAFQEVVTASTELNRLIGHAIAPLPTANPKGIDWHGYVRDVDTAVTELVGGIGAEKDWTEVRATQDRVARAVDNLVVAWAEAERLVQRYNDTSVVFKLESQELDRLRKARDTIRDEVFASQEIPREVQANVSQVLNTNFWPLVYLVQLPSEFLTFALTVSMGLLGSTIHMSRELFRNGHGQDAALTLLWYVARPLEGMAAAIIIYIFFRAGQLTLTGGGAPENKIDDLNPYVLSFLAIASGLPNDPTGSTAAMCGNGPTNHELPSPAFIASSPVGPRAAHRSARAQGRAPWPRGPDAATRSRRSRHDRTRPATAPRCPAA
jgi:hypothetical protein